MGLSKPEIINEIKRTAEANGGVALGWRKFATETGIREPDWKGKLWARWSDAVAEAGFAPNGMKEAYRQEELLERFAMLALQLGRLPADADIRFSVSKGQAFPNWKTLMNQFGGKPALVSRLREHCTARPELAPVLVFCDGYRPPNIAKATPTASDGPPVGFVYLKKSAKYYKIGRASDSARRHRELAIQLPERLVAVHEIRTDDPEGIEAYWHNRFKDKRRGGEWFELTAVDVAVFKRRKFM